MKERNEVFEVLEKMELQTNKSFCTSPAGKKYIEKLQAKYNHNLSEELVQLWEISDGMTLPVTLTDLFSAQQVLELVNNDDGNVMLNAVPIGQLSFGDYIYIKLEDGSIFQVDDVSGDVFLEWESLVDFLQDELLGMAGDC